MRHFTKVIAYLLLASVLSPIIALATFDVAVFQPRMPEIRRLLADASPPEISPSGPLVKVIRASRINLSAHISRLLMQQFDAYPQQSGIIAHHSVGLAWWFLVILHLPESELITLFLSQSHMGNNTTGFATAAPTVVGVPLGEVSVEQAARLVVVARAPSYYLGNPDRLARASDVLASRARDAL